MQSKIRIKQEIETLSKLHVACEDETQKAIESGDEILLLQKQTHGYALYSMMTALGWVLGELEWGNMGKLVEFRPSKLSEPDVQNLLSTFLMTKENKRRNER